MDCSKAKQDTRKKKVAIKEKDSIICTRVATKRSEIKRKKKVAN
jgi:hypothetical protein